MRIDTRSPAFLYALLGLVYCAFQLPFLTSIPIISVDEPWYASDAYARVASSPIQIDAAYWGIGEYCPAYVVLLGSLFKVAGVSLLTTRLFSVLSGAVALAGFVRILQRLNVTHLWIALAGLLFVFSNLHYVVFRSGRSEAATAAALVWAACFLVKAMQDEKPLSFAVSGLLTSVAFLLHPHVNIAVMGIAVLIWSVRKRSVAGLIAFSAGVLLVPLRFLQLAMADERGMVQAFSEDWLGRTSVSDESVLAYTIENAQTFFTRYTLGAKRAFIAVFEIGTLVWGLFYLKRDSNVFLVASLGFFSFLLGLAFYNPFSMRYFSFVLPLSLVTFTLLVASRTATPRFRQLALALGAVYLLNNLAGDAYVVYRDRDKGAYGPVHAAIDDLVPDDATVLSLVNFWFPLKDNRNYNDFTRWRNTPYANLEVLIESGDVDYVVISDYMSRGRSAVAGRADTSTRERSGRYFDSVHRYASTSGDLVETIETDSFGDVEVWRIRP